MSASVFYSTDGNTIKPAVRFLTSAAIDFKDALATKNFKVAAEILQAFEPKLQNQMLDEVIFQIKDNSRLIKSLTLFFSSAAFCASFKAEGEELKSPKAADGPFASNTFKVSSIGIFAKNPAVMPARSNLEDETAATICKPI
ncbi:MAG: hypothetical protein H0U75_06545 [Legionella sp.]|nr:hypothetical protein [Legionella sp.]